MSKQNIQYTSFCEILVIFIQTAYNDASICPWKFRFWEMKLNSSVEKSKGQQLGPIDF